jgi:hypothetical protein
MRSLDMGRRRLGIVARSFTITGKQSDLIDKLARQGRKPASHIVRMALVDYLKQFMDKWECLVCGKSNNDLYIDCFNCTYPKGTQGDEKNLPVLK